MTDPVARAARQDFFANMGRKPQILRADNGTQFMDRRRSATIPPNLWPPGSFINSSMKWYLNLSMLTKFSMLTFNLADKEPATFWPSQCPIPGRAKKKVKARSVDVLCSALAQVWTPSPTPSVERWYLQCFIGWLDRLQRCDRAHNCDLISAVFCFTQFVSVSRFHLDQTRSDEIKHCAPKEALGIEIRWKNCHPAMLLSSQSATEGTNMGDVGRCFGNVFLVFVFFFNNFNIILNRLKFLHIPEWVSCGVPFWSPLPGTSSRNSCRWWVAWTTNLWSEPPSKT